MWTNESSPWLPLVSLVAEALVTAQRVEAVLGASAGGRTLVYVWTGKDEVKNYTIQSCKLLTLAGGVGGPPVARSALAVVTVAGADTLLSRFTKLQIENRNYLRREECLQSVFLIPAHSLHCPPGTHPGEWWSWSQERPL